MLKSPRMTDAQLSKLDNSGAHFKFRDMFARLNTVIATGAQNKRSVNLLLYQQVFSANMPEEQ